MKKRMIDKLRSRSGETIAEALVSIFIFALGSLLFAGMVSASKHMITKAETNYSSFIQAQNTIEEEIAGRRNPALNGNLAPAASVQSVGIKEVEGNVTSTTITNASETVHLYEYRESDSFPFYFYLADGG